jgi:hypothetical protein
VNEDEDEEEDNKNDNMEDKAQPKNCILAREIATENANTVCEYMNKYIRKKTMVSIYTDSYELIKRNKKEIFDFRSFFCEQLKTQPIEDALKEFIMDQEKKNIWKNIPGGRWSQLGKLEELKRLK